MLDHVFDETWKQQYNHELTDFEWYLLADRRCIVLHRILDITCPHIIAQHVWRDQQVRVVNVCVTAAALT